MLNKSIAGGKCKRGRLYEGRDVLRAEVQLLHGRDVLLDHTHGEIMMVTMITMIIITMIMNGDDDDDGYQDLSFRMCVRMCQRRFVKL